MFDSIYGDIKCPKCSQLNNCEIQFKCGMCLLNSYEIGDYVGFEYEEKGHYVIKDWSFNCNYCSFQIKPCAVLRDHKVIALLSEDELDNLDLNDLPDVEDQWAKKEAYKKDRELGIGKTKEYIEFDLHPLNKGDFITALDSEWKLLECYRIETDGTKAGSRKRFLKAGLLANNPIWYLYKVYNEKFGYRWIEVSKPASVIYRVSFRDGNMEVLKEVDFSEEGLIFNKLF